MKLGYILGIIALILMVLSPILSAIIIPRARGYLGEKRVSKILSKLPEDSYKIINDVIIPGQKSLTQIDHVVISRFGIFVLETKNMIGTIYGSEKGKGWTKYSRGRKLVFMNPIHQNYAHIKALEQLLRLPGEIFHGIVIFANNNQFKFDPGENVVLCGTLLKRIREFSDNILDDAQISDIICKINGTNDNSAKGHKKHLEQLRSREEKSAVCPRCGGELVMRTGKYGAFYGCSNFPKCQYTRKKQ